MKKILVVDDEKDIRDLLKSLLEDAGYEVELAKNGEEGLAMLAAGEIQYHCVLMDVMMPIFKAGAVMDGLDAIKAKHRIVIVTGYPEHSDVSKLWSHPNVIEIIQKPFANKDILDAVNSLPEE